MAIGDKRPVVMTAERAVPNGVATLDQSGILTAAQRPNLAQIGGSNPNLLRNWDFRNPVNRNGQAEYSANSSNTIYSIDRWILGKGCNLSVDNNGIKLIYLSNSYNFISQKLESSIVDFLKGKIVTFSALVKGTAILELSTVNNTSKYLDIDHDDWQLCQNTFAFPQNPTDWTQQPMVGIKAGEFSMLAAKLELGTQQTLARQNEDGQWEIIDPPNYDLQYALCSLYSPSTGEWVGSQHSNPNLLDNWYFADPINQRCASEYTAGNSNTYTIDRWAIANAAISIKDGYVTWGSVNSSSACQLTQMLELDEFTPYIGRPFTASILLNNGELYFATITMPLNGRNSALVTINGMSFSLLLAYNYNNSGNVQVSLRIDRVAFSLDIIAAKLELGPVQTLAHQDAGGNWVLNNPLPNKALELAKCQRYYWVSDMSNANYHASCLVPVNELNGGINAICTLQPGVIMRIAPTIKINGASAGEIVTMRNTFTGKTISGKITSDIFIEYRQGIARIGLSEVSGTLNMFSWYEATIELDANL